MWSKSKNTYCLGPLGGVKNLRVSDPTMTSLNVNWDAADGAVRLYKVFYVPKAGGEEQMVRLHARRTASFLQETANYEPEAFKQPFIS